MRTPRPIPKTRRPTPPPAREGDGSTRARRIMRRGRTSLRLVLGLRALRVARGSRVRDPDATALAAHDHTAELLCRDGGGCDVEFAGCVRPWHSRRGEGDAVRADHWAVGCGSAARRVVPYACREPARTWRLKQRSSAARDPSATSANATDTGGGGGWQMAAVRWHTDGGEEAGVPQGVRYQLRVGPRRCQTGTHRDRRDGGARPVASSGRLADLCNTQCIDS